MNPIQPTFGGGPRDGFVTKLNDTGSGLVYSTYLGGDSIDRALSIVLDAAGNQYVNGFTDSTDFPTTPGAFQENPPGGGDTFVTKLNQPGIRSSTRPTSEGPATSSFQSREESSMPLGMPT